MGSASAGLPRVPLIAAAAMFMATLAWRLLTFTGFNNDHYAHLALAQQLLLGDRPVRDFSDPGWPLTYLISAAAWRLAGTAMWVEWAVTASAFACGAALTVLAAYRLSGSLAVAVLMAAVEVAIYPRTYAYPKIVAYAALAFVLAAPASTISRRWLMLLGATIATAFLLRHDHGVWVGFATCLYILLAPRTPAVDGRVARLAIVAATAVLCLLPWAVFVASHGGVISHFETAFEFARAEANASMLRSWPTFSLPAARDVGHLVDANADAWLFWLFWTLPILALALVWRRWQRHDERWPGELAAVAAIAGLAAGINAGFLRDVLRTRLADAIVPAALLGAWLLGCCWAQASLPAVRRRAAHAIAALVLAVSLVAVGTVAEFHEQLERSGIDDGPRAVLDRIGQRSKMLSRPHRQPLSAPSRVSAALMPFYEYLDRCTAPSERLIVTGEFPDVLVLAGRGFAGDGVVFGAWYASAARQDRTVDRLRERPALFVIAVDEEPFRQRFPVIADFIDMRYAPFAELDGEGVRVAILVDPDRETTGRDVMTGWQCYL